MLLSLSSMGAVACAAAAPASRTTASAGEHIRVITEMDSMPMTIEAYNPASGRYESKSVPGSDYIPVGPGDFIQLVCEPRAGSADLSGGEFYIYFYDRDKNVVWSILDCTDESTGERNRISADALRRLNGFQFTGVPDGFYIRVAQANDCACSLLIWDGCRCGYPLSTLTTAFDRDGQLVCLPKDGSACIQVPATATCLIAKPGYTFVDMLTSTPTRSDTVGVPESRFPAQVVFLKGFYGAGRAKNIRIVSDYDYETGTYAGVMPETDLSDMVIAVDEKNYQPAASAETLAAQVFRNIENCLNFTWEAKADIIDEQVGEDYNNTAGMFQKGIVYHGIPYRSSWNAASSVGWHVSKQTFMNAANDPDSIFYQKSEGSVRPYYSLVCSSFATLVTGFPYPMTNFGIMKDPHTYVAKTDSPVIGSLMTNGVGHCFVPLSYSYAGDGSSVLTLAEQINPATAIRSVYEGITDEWKGIGLRSNYPTPYVYCAVPETVSEIPYDITGYTIKNGSARPYRGDQSVYTSAMNVLINIKDPEATRLYYQKFDVLCDHGRLLSAIPDGEAKFLFIEPGTKRVSLRSATRENGMFTGAILENGAIYGVWASKGTRQSEAPDNVEFFEWYDLDKETISYSVKDGALVTDDVFWYARAAAGNEEDYIKETRKAGGITIPYQPPARTGDGPAHADYSNYAARAQIASPSQVTSFFRKGQLGAYVTGKQPAADQSAAVQALFPDVFTWLEEYD